MPTRGVRSEHRFARASTFASYELDAGTLTVRLHGPSVTEREAMIISQELEEVLDALDGRLRAFVLDLHQVQRMTSMGLGLCSDAHERAKALGSRSIVTGLSPELAAFFRMTRVDRLYKIARSDDELTRLLAA
jgi:anti-anti-sigma factor